MTDVPPDTRRPSVLRKFIPQIALVVLIFLGVALLFYFVPAPVRLHKSEATPSPEVAAAIGQVADAVNRVAEHLPVATESPAPRGAAGGGSSTAVSIGWWAAALVGFALLYFVLSRGGDEPWIRRAKIATALAAALTAVAGMVTAGAGAVTAVRNALAPTRDSLAARSVQYVTMLPPAGLFGMPTDVTVVPHPEPKTLLTFAIPYDEASCRADSDGRWPGTSPSTDAARFVQRLGAGLASCAGPGGKPAVEVRGFASSSEVAGYEHCDGAKNANDANVAIAHRRQDRVAELLRQAGGDSLEVLAPRWERFEQMRDDREYNDRLAKNVYSPARATLTRRVEIRLVSAVACAAAPPPSPAAQR